MSKKKKLRKKIGSRLVEGESALVVCMAKKCAPREEARALVEGLRAHVATSGVPVRIEMFGCLGICKKGPIVATLPKVRIKKRVDLEKGLRLVDKLAAHR